MEAPFFQSNWINFKSSSIKRIWKFVFLMIKMLGVVYICNERSSIHKWDMHTHTHGNQQHSFLLCCCCPIIFYYYYHYYFGYIYFNSNWRQKIYKKKMKLALYVYVVWSSWVVILSSFVFFFRFRLQWWWWWFPLYSCACVAHIKNSSYDIRI